MKFYEFGRSFFRKRVQIRRNFATKCTIRGTRGAKLPVDATFSGRSMVEMLGVLAIIGVLSVGAIAGYSKAMMKYKLNKQAEALNMLLNNSLIYSKNFSFEPEKITHYCALLKKLNLIPDAFTYLTDSFIEDVFGNRIDVQYNNQKSGNSYNNWTSLSISFQSSSSFSNIRDVCINAVTVAKGNSASLWRISTTRANTDGSFSYYGYTYGDQYCGGSYKCLRNLSLQDLSDLCNVCDTGTCTLYFTWK